MLDRRCRKHTYNGHRAANDAFISCATSPLVKTILRPINWKSFKVKCDSTNSRSLSSTEMRQTPHGCDETIGSMSDEQKKIDSMGIVALFGIETYDAIDLATTTTHQSREHPHEHWMSEQWTCSNHLIWSWVELEAERRVRWLSLFYAEYPKTNRFMGGGVQTRSALLRPVPSRTLRIESFNPLQITE